MKKIYLFVLGMMLLPIFCNAQNQTPDFDTFKKEVYDKYTHWYVSVYGGLPFTQGGDMVTFAKNKTHLGYMGGVQLGYQVTPCFGVSLSGQYGQMKAGAKEVETNYLLQPSGKVIYSLAAPEDALRFDQVYASIKHITAGLHFDFNVAPLFCGTENRKVALVLSPAVYMQKFNPVINKVADDKRFTNADLKNNPDFGVGGDVDFRYRASKHMDVMLKAGAAWIHNNNFDGVDNVGTQLKYAALGHVALGLVWKIGNSGEKIDNIIYAPNNKRINEMYQEMLAEQVVVEEPAEVPPPPPAPPVVSEEPKPAPPVKEEVKEFPELPTIHFAFDSDEVDTTEYASELATIVTTLKEFADVHVEITGYTDHKGTDAYNDALSVRRAEAIKKYLIEQGVDAARLSIVGEGKDPKTSGSEALTIKARRVEIAK